MANSKVIFGDETLIDLTSDTVTADTLAEGITAHGADGELITGTMESGGLGDEGLISADDFTIWYQCKNYLGYYKRTTSSDTLGFASSSSYPRVTTTLIEDDIYSIVLSGYTSAGSSVTGRTVSYATSTTTIADRCVNVGSQSSVSSNVYYYSINYSYDKVDKETLVADYVCGFVYSTDPDKYSDGEVDGDYIYYKMG